MTSPTSKRIAFETARLSIARHVIAGEQARQQAVAHAAAVSAQALNIERVGLWYFDDEDTNLICQCLYTLTSKSFTSGAELDARMFPNYLAGLRERRVIAATDARTHRVTGELTASYLTPNGIVSVLDAPIILHGHVVGVVCHEHVGSPREFEQHELDFAGSVADMIAMIEEQSARLQLESTLREQEERMQRAAKLEALGRLARTAAHDFNNVLTSVIGGADLLLNHADPRVTEAAHHVIEAAEMGARIAQQLLVLGRDGAATPMRVELARALASMVPVLSARFGADLQVQTELLVTESAVLADPSQVERILLNLCINAGEASDGRGLVEIRVREPRANEVRGRGWLALEVRDQGVGLSDDARRHLFEPYFTTKTGGTGLGLASVYGIVRQLKGRVYADSVQGRGTTFVVLLPRAM